MQMTINISVTAPPTGYDPSTFRMNMASSFGFNNGCNHYFYNNCLNFETPLVGAIIIILFC